MGTLRALDRLVGHALHAVASTCLVLLLAIVAALVFNRLVPFASLGWTDEIIELLFAWLVFIGAAAVWRTHGHFCVDALLVSLAPSARRRLLQLAIAAANMGFMFTMAWLSLALTLESGESSPVFAASKVYWYGVMPAMFAVMFAYCVRDVVVVALTFFRRNEDEQRPPRD